MSNETIAWKICYTDNGQYRTALSEHNSVGDYRAIDPMASSIALCAAPVSAEPDDKMCRQAYDDFYHKIRAEIGYDHWCAIWRFIAKRLAAPVAAQPDVTQQTLDDVMAGIPARDAEIAALRKEIETMLAAQAQQYVSDGNLADRLDVLADTASPGSQMQSDLYAAATIWRKHLKGPAAQQPVSGADGMGAAVNAFQIAEAEYSDRMTENGLLFDPALAVEAGLIAARNHLIPIEQAQLSGNPGQLDHLPDATKMVPGDQFRDAAQMIEPSGTVRELPSDDWLAGCVGVQNQGGLRQITGLADIRRFAECVLKHWGKQDADKVDAEQWVSVNERLPEIHEWRAGSIAGISDAVLTIDEDDPDTMTVQHLRKGGQGDLTTLYWDHGDSPTHWRPAPSLPGIDAARKEPDQ